MKNEKKLDISKKLNEIIIKNCRSDLLENDKFDDKTDLIKDIEFDSVSIMRLVIDVEREFNIEFSDEDLNIEIVGNYGELLNYIVEKSNKTK